MVKFRCKNYSIATKAKNAVPYLSLGVGTGSLILSGANLATNKSRQRQDLNYQKQHLDEMKSLSKNLAANTRAMNTMRSSMNDYTTSMKNYYDIQQSSPVKNNSSNEEVPRRKRFFGLF